MAALPRDRHRPAIGAAPRGRGEVEPVVLREAFEVECDVGPAARLDHRPARDFDRVARIFLVAGQEHGDVGVLERARGLHCAKRGEDYRDPALVVDHARPFRDLGASAHPALERRVRLEHGVVMGDQEHALAPAIALVARDQVARPVRGLHVEPLDLEAQRFELGADHARDRLDPGEVHRPAVLVHPLLEQADRAFLLGIDSLDHLLLGAGELGRGGRGDEEGGGAKRSEESAHGAKVARPAALVIW